MIVRPIEIVKGWDNIAKRFDRNVRTVKAWQRQGAPIYLVDGAWTAEVAELWTWVGERTRRTA